MVGDSRPDGAAQVFADQFSRDAHGLIYRKSQKGAPIRVSEAERDGFVATFNKQKRYAMWATVSAILALLVPFAWMSLNTNSATIKLAKWAGIVAIFAIYMTIHFWIWNAPSRALRNRPPEGAALTKAEARELAFSKITFGQLGFCALMGAGLVWKMSIRTDVFHGWGRIWLVAGGMLIALAGIQAIRKWYFSQHKPAERD
jgi:hypothetical protein